MNCLAGFAFLCPFLSPNFLFCSGIAFNAGFGRRATGRRLILSIAFSHLVSAKRTIGLTATDSPILHRLVTLRSLDDVSLMSVRDATSGILLAAKREQNNYRCNSDFSWVSIFVTHTSTSSPPQHLQ
jgi:hypothetical protein